MLAGAVVVETEEGELMVERAWLEVGVVLEPDEGALMVEGAGLEGVVHGRLEGGREMAKMPLKSGHVAFFYPNS
ncbi:hypothetical protein RHMOL_Rhmol10G0290500 [Rhododendron molle]|uniref:Uncharacterized protein n=1 Tax=Rhododendron molle TaxID=49168 RepID=A0ACC0M8P3_RHOML|nr:hypothetical protein RHMOL_Rhmol10G0290500 [Rhododendron molle]